MKLRLPIFLTGLLAWVTAALLAFAPLGAAHAAVYDTDFLDSFAASMRGSAISLTMADLQSGIGDGVKKGWYAEGDLSHAALHGLVGCAAGEALGGTCASGFAAGVAQSVYAGMLDGTGPDKSDTAAYNAWRTQVANQAELIGAGVGYITSGGLAANVSGGGSIARSGAVHNYLSHTETAEKLLAEQRLAECETTGACDERTLADLRAEILQWTLLDEARDMQIKQLCAEGNALSCIDAYNALGGMLEVDRQFYDTLDPSSELAKAIFTEGAQNDGLRSELLALGGAAGARNTQVMMNGFGVGAAGGAASAMLVFGGPAALRCAANYACRMELAKGIADEIAMTPGAFTGTIVVTGSTVKVADRVIGSLDDAHNFVRAPNRTLDDIIASGQRLPSTGGRTTQIQKAGGFDQANADFDALGLNNVRDIRMPNGGTGRVGELPDGTRVVVRSTSSDRVAGHTSQPTLEIQRPDGPTKIRY